MGRMRTQPGECIGSGGLPVPASELFERGGTITGIFVGCEERVTLTRRHSSLAIQCKRF